MSLRIDVREAGDVTVLELTGHLVLGLESQTLSQRVKQLVAEGKKKIVVNAKNVAFIDSCGVGELVAAYTTLKKNEGAFKLASPQKMVSEVLRLSRLPTVIEVFDTEEKALASFA